MTPEQQQLINKSRDSLRAAQLLSREELYDIAVSRAEEFITLAQKKL